MSERPPISSTLGSVVVSEENAAVGKEGTVVSKEDTMQPSGEQSAPVSAGGSVLLSEESSMLRQGGRDGG